MTRRSKFFIAIAACVMLIGAAWILFAETRKKAPVVLLQAPSSTPTHPQLVRKVSQDPLRILPLRHDAHPNEKNEGEKHVAPDDLKTSQEALVGIMRCKWAADAERGIRNELDKPISLDPAAAATGAEDDKIKLLQDNLTRLTAVRANCADQSEEKLDKDVYDKLLAAARLGDRNAATCYIVAPYEAPSLQADPVAFDEYNRNAADLIQAGIAAGDWNMVYLLESGSSPSRGQSGWFDALLLHDGLTTYKYEKLRRLGTIDEEAVTLDAELTRQARRLVASGTVSPDDIRNADQWAQAMYETYFANSQRLTEPPAPCQDPTGGLRGVVM